MIIQSLKRVQSTSQFSPFSTRLFAYRCSFHQL